MITRLGVQGMREGTKSEMLSFLKEVAMAKNLTGQNVRGWVMEEYGKLQVINITTVKSTLSWIVTLNSKLCHAGILMMHRQTLNHMACKGVETLLPTQPPPKEHPKLPTSISAGPTPDPVLPSPEMGQCLACDGIGLVGSFCDTCNNIGLSYVVKEDSNESIKDGLEELDDLNRFEPEGGQSSCTATASPWASCCPLCQLRGSNSWPPEQWTTQKRSPEV
jgi:hypothetical protein